MVWPGRWLFPHFKQVILMLLEPSRPVAAVQPRFSAWTWVDPQLRQRIGASSLMLILGSYHDCASHL